MLYVICSRVLVLLNAKKRPSSFSFFATELSRLPAYQAWIPCRDGASSVLVGLHPSSRGVFKYRSPAQPWNVVRIRLRSADQQFSIPPPREAPMVPATG